ncbi:hypothetical protein GLP30_17180 [Photobacterium phosphoreum]|uniref:Uncharacterized protein n=1 Tax=Photobacterium phosphoreum TaxID=659 RepID=A0AAW5A069_PHOPO|nr:hypothetical protein [Photobacterium phosphoreum]MCD9492613.1 hypothetical protein [Photobacterium phosphoreum]MCF2191822.1 hypothetical protein [Photobacterium phosphoreum]MCF2303445.1 hypothetical protein [Photobacterium phosphoreum]
MALKPRKILKNYSYLFTLNIEQMMAIHEQGCDAYRAGINENPYKHKLKSKCWREGWESIMAFEA